MKQLHFCHCTKKPESLFKESPISAQNLSHTKFLKFSNSLLFTIIFVAFAQVCWGQDVAVGDYRSRTSGSWVDKTTWNRWSGTSWDKISGTTFDLPGINSNVTIQGIHTITLNGNVSIANLTIDAGGILTFSAALRLDVLGILTINGQFTVVAGADVNVNGNTVLGKSKCLLLKSNESTTGSVISGSFSGTGTMTVERFLSYSDNWHLFSSPISDQSIYGFITTNNEIPNLVNSSGEVIGVGMRDYDTKNDCWKLYQKTTSSPWNPYFVYENTSTISGSIGGGKGFGIRTNNDDAATGTIDATGFPNPNNFIFNLETTGNRWNCIGNPFTSALNVKKFLLADTSLFDNTYKAIYVWTSSEGKYSVYNMAGSQNIQLGQGFFVKSKLTGGDVRFTPVMQVNEGTISFKSAESEWPSIDIVVRNQTLKSSTEIKFIPNTTKGLDQGYDAGMLKANKDFALYSKLLIDNGADFMLQCLPDQDFDQYVIPIGIDFKVGGDITFTAEAINLPSGCQAFLEDRLTKRFTRLDLKDAKYTTTVSANTKGTGRFFLHTSDVISGDQPIEKEPFKISKIGKTLYINGEVSDKANFYVYSINGKQLANFKAVSQVQNEFDASGLPAGVYILTTDDQNQKKSTKFVIEN